jgi:hypothetical protein
VVLYHAIPCFKGRPSLGPVAFVGGAAVSLDLPFQPLAILHFLWNQPYIVALQILSPLGGRIPAMCSFVCNSLHHLNSLSLSFLTVNIFFLAWFLGRCINIVVFLETLEPRGLQILEGKQPDQSGVVYMLVKLFSVEEFMKMFKVSSQWPLD